MCIYVYLYIGIPATQFWNMKKKRVWRKFRSNVEIRKNNLIPTFLSILTSLKNTGKYKVSESTNLLTEKKKYNYIGKKCPYEYSNRDENLNIHSKYIFIYNMLAVFFQFIFRARYESALINDNYKLNKRKQKCMPIS